MKLDITCAMCNKLLSRYDAASDSYIPSPEKLHEAGMIAVPNFGWFCSQECAHAFEESTGFQLRRDETGKISYYDDVVSFDE
jgi:hypothetical protein